MLDISNLCAKVAKVCIMIVSKYVTTADQTEENKQNSFHTLI